MKKRLRIFICFTALLFMALPIHAGGSTDAEAAYQFCPVTTYHMEGSFRTRMGLIPPQDPTFDGNNNYEWDGYSYVLLQYKGIL